MSPLCVPSTSLLVGCDDGIDGARELRCVRRVTPAVRRKPKSRMWWEHTLQLTGSDWAIFF